MSQHNGNANTPKPRIRWNPILQLRTPSPGSSQRPLQRPNNISSLREVLPPWPLTSDQVRTVKSRMNRLCESLDALLDAPVRNRRISATCKQTIVMGAWAFEADSVRRRISAGPMGVEGSIFPVSHPFEIGIPLEEADWIPSLLKCLDVGFLAQRDVFMGTAGEEDWDHWLCRKVEVFLRHEPRFQRLRHRTLAQAHSLPRDILGMALAARTRPVGRLLDSRLLNIVWQHENLFRQTARENPQMMPLVAALIAERGSHEEIPDPVQALKHHFRRSGVSEAGWRYVAHHGARIFRSPWSTHGSEPALKLATLYMQALDGAGLPPVPPPSISNALWWSELALAARVIRCPSDVLRAGLLEADRRRRSNQLGDFWVEFFEVCDWASSPFCTTETSSLDGNWRRLVRAFQRYQEEEIAQWDSKNLHWKCSLRSFDVGTFTIVPLESSEDLIREGLAMRNCLESYQDDCFARKYEIYLVRDRVTRKRHACIGLFRSPDGSDFSIDQVKGYANRSPGSDALQAAQVLLCRIAEVTYFGRAQR